MAVARRWMRADAQRRDLYGFTILALLANGYVGEVANKAARLGVVEGLLAGFGISVIEMAAISVMALLLERDADDAAADGLDLAACVATFAFVLFPDHRVTWLGATLFAAYVAGRTCRPWVRSAACILMSLALAKFWGKLLLVLFAAPLVRFDTLATYLLARLFDGNVAIAANILTTEQGHELVIMRGCSSVSNISQALLAWIALPRLARPAVTLGDLALAPLIAAVVVLLNTSRMGLMLVGPSWYVFLHDGPGATVFNGLTLLIIGALCYLRGQHVSQLRPVG